MRRPPHTGAPPSSTPRVLAIHDISGVGRCSLTVALPVISAAGIECSVLPTAVLSTHTGGFTGYTFRDLTGDLLPIAQHWETLGLTFDAIYTGYLGSFEQIELVQQVIARLRRPDTRLIVDPVMGDAGALYAGFAADFPRGMRHLCAGADVIVPNLTEAALLLDRPYREHLSAEEVEESVHTLTRELGARAAVLTGVSLRAGQLGAAAYDSGGPAADSTGRLSLAQAERIGGLYHGTGDVFSSVLTAGLVKGLSLSGAVRVAVDFTVAALKRSFAAQTDPRYGVQFEVGLASLSALIGAEAAAERC